MQFFTEKCIIFTLICFTAITEVRSAIQIHAPADKTHGVSAAKFRPILHKTVYQSTLPKVYYADWSEQGPAILPVHPNVTSPTLPPSSYASRFNQPFVPLVQSGTKAPFSKSQTSKVDESQLSIKV